MGEALHPVLNRPLRHGVLSPQRPAQLGERPRVEHVAGLGHARRATCTPQRSTPKAACECASLAMTSGTPRSRASRAGMSSEVQPIDLAVDFERHAGGVRPRRRRFHVERQRFAPQQDAPAGRMADDVHPGALDRAEQRVRHGRAVLPEPRVDRGHHEVERRQAVVGEIQRAVGADVALDAGEQRDALERAPISRMRAACSSARRSSRPLAIASAWLWSVIAMYSSPASRAARAIVSMSSRPSVAVVCMWRSPRSSIALDEPRQAPASAASISPRFSRNSGGTHARPSAS